MRTLFLTGSSARYMMPPKLGDEQINAGPDWLDERAPDGRWRSLQTPAGEYDLAAPLARLPREQQPDAVVALVDASWRNMPRNLGAFPGPKALLVADTHHLNSPLIGMFRYAATEAYDRIVFLYDRHHAGIFRAAGFRNVFWFPGLTFPHDDATVRAARRSGARLPQIAFVGQAGKYHPRRARMLAALTAAKAPLKQRALGQREGLPFYGASLLGFNASLNGDLNLRVFEILATGAALLTDRLAPESGLLELFGDGRELLTYGSAAELAERAAHALAHPQETAALGTAGAAWFDAHFNEACRRTAFQELLFNGTSLPEFALPEAPRYFNGDVPRLLQTMMVYEGAQELHRMEETVRLVLTPGVPADVAEIFATLPRVETVRGTLDTPADIAVFTRDDDIVPATVQAPRIWCCDAQPEEHAILNDFLQPAGFTPVSSDVAVLCRVAPTVATPMPQTEATLAPKVPAEGYDLIISHVEINSHHGTGVLLQRFFKDTDEAVITLRGRSLYQGRVELGSIHWALEDADLPVEQRAARLRQMLAPYRIRRILCVPYYAADFLHGLLAKKITGAPLCSYVMDDQTIYARHVPRELARALFADSALRLAISPEMAQAYERVFAQPFHYLPPVLPEAAGGVANSWDPQSIPADRLAMLGNVWTAKRFQQLREFVRATGLTIDWFGNGPKASWLAADPAALAREGIHCRGFLPEDELAATLARYPAVIIPSGMLDATEDNEAFSRLSLPSRMLFVLVKSRTPMLVLGSPETAAGHFVREHGIGLSTSHDPAEAAACLRELTEPASRPAYLAAAEQAAARYVLPRAGEWIWASLAQRTPRPAPFDRLYPTMTPVVSPARTEAAFALQAPSALV